MEYKEIKDKFACTVHMSNMYRCAALLECRLCDGSSLVSFSTCAPVPTKVLNKHLLQLVNADVRG